MAESLLGLEFEIHGGGSDLVFPHHENEAAQTRAARDRDLARLWVHNGMVRFGDDKMAKSVGNVRPLAEEVDRWGRDALLMYFSAGHYRQPIAYSDSELEQAQASVQRVREAARRLHEGPSPEDMASLRDRFFDALAEDFNTAAALDAMFRWVREANKREDVGDSHLREMLGVLGLENLLAGGGAAEPDAEALELAGRREAARAQRDFAEADRLRDELRARGWEVRDSPEGPELLPLDAS
jgi:cysteinyl-tRNA synthetase